MGRTSGPITRLARAAAPWADSERHSAASVGPSVELTGLPPVSETIVEADAFDEKLAGGDSGPTICWADTLRINEPFRAAGYATKHSTNATAPK